jgi:hypothetical protein
MCGHSCVDAVVAELDKANMAYPEEDYARELEALLRNSVPQCAVSLTGVGVHWNVNVANQSSRQCSIDCFDVRGAQYYIKLITDGSDSAVGRTFVLSETIDVVRQWFANAALDALYSRFDFLDKEKRILLSMELNAIQRFQELRECSHELGGSGDSYALSFSHVDRDCEIHCYKSEVRLEFYWGACHLFMVRCSEISDPLLLLKRWVYDRAALSEVEREYPGVSTGKISSFYEQGRGVEGELICSWDWIAAYFKEQCPSPEVQSFIQSMRELGYDKVLRAGQSLWWLLLSRSRRHGMDPGQPFIAFCFSNKGTMTVEVRIDKPVIIEGLPIRFDERIKEILEQLASRPLE